MYGLLLENLAEYIKINYGEDKWDDIRRQVGIDSPSFSVHQVYPETLLNKLAKKAQTVRICTITFKCCYILFKYYNISKKKKNRYLVYPNVNLWIKWVFVLLDLLVNMVMIGYCQYWDDT